MDPNNFSMQRERKVFRLDADGPAPPAAVRELQSRLSDLTGVFTIPGGSFAGNLKAALEMLGLCGSTVLPPLSMPTDNTRAAIRALLQRHSLL